MAAKTLRIERAAEETVKHGLRVKGPKNERGKRCGDKNRLKACANYRSPAR
jgi:hypothetical protein